MSRKAARKINKQRKKIAKLNRRMALASRMGDKIRGYQPIDNSELDEVLKEAVKAVRPSLVVDMSSA